MMLDLNYVEIILKNGKKSLIDPEDSYYINQWKWYFDLGYAKRKSSKEDAQSRWMIFLLCSTSSFATGV